MTKKELLEVIENAQTSLSFADDYETLKTSIDLWLLEIRRKIENA